MTVKSLLALTLMLHWPPFSKIERSTEVIADVYSTNSVFFGTNYDHWVLLDSGRVLKIGTGVEGWKRLELLDKLVNSTVCMTYKGSSLQIWERGACKGDPK